MENPDSILYKTNMRYFAGLTCGFYNHIPRCEAWIDRTFDMFAINFAYAGRIRYALPVAATRKATPPTITLEAPIAWWTIPGPRYVYGNLPGETWDHYYMTFRGPRANRMLRDGLIPSDPASFSRINDPETFRALFESLLQTAETSPLDSPNVIHALESLFLHLSTQSAPESSNPANPEPLDVLASTIREHPHRPWDFAAQAAAMNVTPTHFRRLFRARTGLSPVQCLLKVRIDQAARRLRGTSDPVKKIAADIGIPDVFYFSKLFKARYHRPPGKYRDQTQLRD